MRNEVAAGVLFPFFSESFLPSSVWTLNLLEESAMQSSLWPPGGAVVAFLKSCIGAFNRSHEELLLLQDTDLNISFSLAEF